MHDDTPSPEYARLFARHDDPVHWEFPLGFDPASEYAAFAAFVDEFRRRISGAHHVETGSEIQDASYHSAILGEWGQLRFSNFGRMVAFTDDATVPAVVRTAVRDLAVQRGYLLVPTSELGHAYPHSDRLGGDIGSWWIRYFDYL